ncbi:MAG: ATPase [Bacteroidales bacterium]|jgi:N-acetylglucosamine kinase-like BadF-type ATPase|nr:ATPase [Bacteroidales bacterium]
MIIIADSGSTKIDWRIIEDTTIIQHITEGFNPYYHKPELLENFAREIAEKTSRENIKSIYFYGSGCSTETNYKIVTNALKKSFPNAFCFVYHDLLAAARALFRDEGGIACILGTGSNSCLYDGVSVIENVPSVGWMIGDEGSGVYIGKLLITDYLRFTMPSEIRETLEKEYKLTFENVLNEIYTKDNPNNFFSSFPPFIFNNINNKYCYDLVMRNFDDFFKWQISKYTDYINEPIAFVGSIAYHFKDQIYEWGKKNNLRIGEILKAPMDGLIKYHSR